MSSMNLGNALIPKSPVSPESILRTLQQLSVLFSKLWTPVQLLLAAGGLAMAVYFGIALRLTLLNTHNSVAMALAVKPEPTRTRDQGISAFLLSGVKDEWARTENLRMHDLDPIFQEMNSTVQKLTAETALKGTSRRSAAEVLESKPTASSVSRIIRELSLTVHTESKPWQTWQTAIISQREESFMMVPEMSFRRKSLNEPPSTDPEDQSRLVAALQQNPEILFDLNLAAKLEPTMRKLDKASGDRLLVVQTYFITESGVFLIRANGVNHQGNYYGKQFQRYTQFMDRPYFWGAVDVRQPRPTIFDYASKPYLDLGGNGFVVTFSKKFDLPNGRVGVLCVDAKLPDEVTDEIERHLKELGANVSDFYWSEDKGIEPGKEGPLPSQFSWFTRQLQQSREAQSEFVGNIRTESASRSVTPPDNKAASLVRFTVPVSSEEYQSGKKRTRLLWVEFDSASILKKLTTNLALFTTGIFLVIAVTWSLFRNYTVLKREMSNVLEKISKVMLDAATPFVWLNEKNEFVKINRSMLHLLGHNNIEELRKQSLTFKGLVTDETQHVYEKVLERSGAGKETGEYEICVVTKNGTVLRVRAHGERIPYPTWWRRGIPHRFGIFVEVTADPGCESSANLESVCPVPDN